MKKLLLLSFVIILLCPGLPSANIDKVPQNSQSDPLLDEAVDNALGFEISLEIFNPVTEKPQSTFFFGDKVGYEITANIPPTAEGKKATINLSAGIKIGGMTIPFTTSHVFSGPLTNITYKDVDLFEPRTWKGTFDIDREIPVSDITLTIKADITIRDIGTTRLVKTITLKTKRQLPQPILTYPVDASNMINNTGMCSTSSYRMYFTFTWNTIPWATKYEVSITNTEHNATFTYTTEKANLYMYNIGCFDNNYQTWKWKVRAGNHYCWSDWSQERNFTVKVPPPPTLLTPSDGAVLDNGCSKYPEAMAWSFDWADVSGATYYNLVVYHVGDSSNYIDTWSPTSQYSFSPYNYTTNLSNWRWKVRAYVGGGRYTDWSSERSFSVEPVNTDCP